MSLEHNHGDREEVEVAEAEVSDSIIKRLQEIYKRLPPERQFVFGAFASYVYLTILVAPEKFPQIMQLLLRFVDSVPTGRASVWFTLLIALAGTADGARRIVQERFPFYKAYIQVFVLGRFAEGEELGEVDDLKDKLN